MFHMPTGPEWFVVFGVALLIFGKRLPEVGRSLGQSIVEFKKGLKGVKDEMDEAEREVDKQLTKSPDPARLTGIKDDSEESARAADNQLARDKDHAPLA